MGMLLIPADPALRSVSDELRGDLPQVAYDRHTGKYSSQQSEAVKVRIPH